MTPSAAATSGREGVGAAAAGVAAGEAGAGHQAVAHDRDAVAPSVGSRRTRDVRAAEEGDAAVDHVRAARRPSG